MLTSNPLLGIIFHAIGGIAAASFYVPYKKVKRWPWEIYWLFGGIFSWLIVPFFVCLVTLGNPIKLLENIPFSVLVWPYMFGVLWGFGGLTFGLTLRYLGISLGTAVALGLTAIFGTLIPPLVDGSLSTVIKTSNGQLVLLGILIGIAGIFIIGKSGQLKEKSRTKQTSDNEFNFKKGLVVAIISGILSACFAFGVAAGKQLTELGNEHATNPLFSNSLLFVVIMLGGLTTNSIWCIVKLLQLQSLQTIKFTAVKLNLMNAILCASAGTIWYFQFFFYGMGSTLMRDFEFASWSLHMSFIILFGTVWGLIFKEWNDTSKNTKVFLAAGLFILVVSTVFIGIGNST